MRSFEDFWPYCVRQHLNPVNRAQHPLWSLRGDLRMYGLMWTGRMGAEALRLSRVAA